MLDFFGHCSLKHKGDDVSGAIIRIVSFGIPERAARSKHGWGRGRLDIGHHIVACLCRLALICAAGRGVGSVLLKACPYVASHNCAHHLLLCDA